MRVFEGKWPERGAWEPSEGCGREMASLVGKLKRRGVRYRAASRGRMSCVVFDSPHGVVSVISAPGSIGSDRGLLESYCEGWDMSPRGNMTASGICSDYMHGAWG